MERNHDTSDDTSSDSDLLDKSLSMWIGWEAGTTSDPLPLDLHTAASLGDYDCVKDILSRRDTDPDRPNRSRWTPLMYASYIGHGNIVGLLIGAGVDVNTTTEDGTTALMLAASCGKDGVVTILHQKSAAKLDFRNRRGWTALFSATFSGHQSTVQLLVSLGVDVHRAERSLGLTPLMLAAAEGHEVIAAVFLEKGVDVTVKNKRGDTARSLAILNEHMSIVALIDDRNTLPSALRSDPDIDPSSSDESFQLPGRPHHRRSFPKVRGPSIQDGPAMFARMLSEKRDLAEQAGSSNQPAPGATVRDPSSGRTENNPFCISDAVTIRSSASPSNCSSENLAATPGMSSTTTGPRDGSKACPASVRGAPGVSLTAPAPGSSREGSLSSNAEDGDINSVGLDQYFMPLNISDVTRTTPLTDFASHLGGSRHPQGNFIPPLGHRRTSGGTPYDPAGNQSVNKYNLVNFDPLTHFKGIIDPGVFHKHEGREVILQPRKEPVSHIGYIPSIPPLAIPSSVLDNRNVTVPSFPNDHTRLPPFFFPDPNKINPSICDGRYEIPTDGIKGKHKLTPYTTGEQSGRLLSGMRDIGDLRTFLERLDLSKYLPVFGQEDVDLRVFLTLTDSDLKEVGIKLMGPRRKMTNAIARWHVGARALSDVLEQVYADRMENVLQETVEKHQQVLTENGELEAQLAQEKELRRVVEGCLVEDRKTYQHMLGLVTDTASLCHRMREMYDSVRFYQNELSRRIQVNGIPGSILLSPEELAQRLRTGLDLDNQFPSFDNKLTTLACPISNKLAHPNHSNYTIPGTGFDPASGDAYNSIPPITEQDRRYQHSSAIGGPLPLDDRPTGDRAINIYNISMEELVGHLSQVSHQMARVVAKAANNMDQLLEGQTKRNFSPNSSGNSLP